MVSIVRGKKIMAAKKIILGAFLLLAFGGVGIAQAQVFDDWIVDVNDPTFYSAVTVNDSGHQFGQVCIFNGDSSCYWVIDMSTTCKKGDKYPVLANADSAAVYLEMICTGPIKGGGSGYAFTNFDQVDKLVRESKRVGFAVPLQDDEFVVVRWNLRGAGTALSAMQEAAEKRLKSVPQNTRDKRL